MSHFLSGAIAAFVLNTLQMTIIFALFRWMKKVTKGYLPYLFFCFAWVAWEHLYFTWQISWPWLVLGNSFATSIKNIQWYEYTGTVGGSFWILLVNTLMFRTIKLISQKQRSILSILSLTVLIIAPIIVSHIIFSNYKEESDPVNVAILQPNIDPYKAKFSVSQNEQDKILLSLADSSLNKVKGNVLLLAPETFLSPVSWRTRIDRQPGPCAGGTPRQGAGQGDTGPARGLLRQL